MMKRDVMASERYQKFTQLEHILARPDTYVGSLTKDTDTMWVLNSSKTGMEQRTVTHVPGLFKIYDEILVNAIDQSSTDQTVDSIKVVVDQADGSVTISNTGTGIPVETHSKENMPIPELIFGELLTSSNYDDTVKRTVGGRNGYGAKLANAFSKLFQIEIIDVESQQKLTMSWINNMKEKTKPKVTKKTCTKGLVKITFVPDLERFGMTHIDDDTFALFEKRAYDACACTPDHVGVYFNGKKLAYKNFEKYVDLYIGNKKETSRIYESSYRWDVAVCHSNDGYKQVSFVNGINTSTGGTHVEHVTRKLVNTVIQKVTSKNPNSAIKATFVKEHLFVFVKATLENPSFSSQTKTECTLKTQSFGSSFECSEDFQKKLLKIGVMDDALALAKHKEMRELSKTDGKKRTTVKGIPKLDDANWAGTSKSAQCTLILTEGDSAKTFAVSGLSVVGRDKYGIFPLRGKLLNVREATPKQLLDNAEINALKQIMGLQQGKVYTNRSELRYGSIQILTDADVDGSHIKGLIINVFHCFWPSLLQFDDFVQAMVTPVIKVSKRNEEHSFYTLSDYNLWKESVPCNGSSYTTKYYKGLGTSTSAEAKEYFRNMATSTVRYIDDGDTTNNIELAFKKDNADMRKKWILDGIKNASTIEYSGNNQAITYSDFVNKDLIQFSIADVERSIPSAIDGFKTSQRKVVFACRKRKNTEIKVSQLAGYASTESAYHHGEQSLMSTIVGLAQDFVGSNNENILVPKGQFGTRLMGGKDAASPRYIFTMLSQVCQEIIRSEDDPLLKYLDDDGMPVEPEYYVPTIPLVLVNGAEGIGTGYSCSVPCYNPKDIKDNITRCLNNEEMVDMCPWYKGFVGTIEKADGGFKSEGCYTLKGGTMEITELPVGRWTQDYKEFLDTLLDTKVSSYENHSTEDKVRFVLKLEPKCAKMGRSDILKTFKLTTGISTRNMHLFDSNGHIKKYGSPLEIIEEFVSTRMEFYRRRKEHIVTNLQKTLQILENKVRFIKMVTNDELVIFKKKKDVIISELRYLQFHEDGRNGFDYLLNMKLYNLTHEDIVTLEKQHAAANAALATIRKTSTRAMWLSEI